MTVAQHFFAETPRLLDIDARDARHILAARSWCIFRRSRQDPLPRIRGYLQSGIVAMRFALMMDVVQQIWPDPLAIHRPCCPTASVDEVLLGALIKLAIDGRRPAFDELLRDMIGAEARELLFARAQMLYQKAD